MENSLLAVRDVSLHFIETELPNTVPIFICRLIGSVHVNVHNMPRNHLGGFR